MCLDTSESEGLSFGRGPSLVLGGARATWERAPTSVIRAIFPGAQSVRGMVLSRRQILRGLLTAAAGDGPLRGSGAGVVRQRCGSGAAAVWQQRGRALARPPPAPHPPPTRGKVAESGEIEISPD